MLVQIAIRNIVLIERLDLELGPGLTILTGETGAGKSILLDAFSLALGSRGDGSLVREGQRDGQVAATFNLAEDHPAAQAARRAGVPCEGELILRRLQYADGRTRALVNDEPVSVQTLRGIGRELVEIHGQHDDRALVDPATHRSLVDMCGNLGVEVARVRDAFVRVRDLTLEAVQEQKRVDQARSENDYRRHALDELTKLGATPSEETHLAERRSTMMQAEKVATELVDAQGALSGDHGAISALAALAKRLTRRAAQAPALIDPCIGALDGALEALESAARTVDDAIEAARYDPRDLENAEERLFALRAASRKYGAPTDELPQLRDRYAAELAAFEAGETRLAALARDLEAARRDYRKAATDLSASRRKQAERLAKTVNSELAPLKLAGARFWAEIASDATLESVDGFDRVEFWVQTNPGSRPGPLMKVASGGELARFMLALKVALVGRGSAPTLIFDEIDTGAGGAAADAIGQRLARLAEQVQVLAVTHAPQVAARATEHFRISKDNSSAAGQATATRVVALETAARREEIARMLSGATITDEARAAAVRLLETN